MSRIAVCVVALMLALPMLGARVLAQDAGTLKVAQDEANGAFLTNADGMTVYLFTPDTTAGESTCYERCAEAWPPVPPEDATALPPGVPGELTTIERTDGTQQVAYNDIPLYYWVQDQAPGDVTGQGVGGVWFIVPPGAELTEYAPAPGEGTPVPTASLKIGFTEELGPFLIDAEGMTVYLFTKDVTAGESTCVGDCLVNWPPVPAPTMAILPPGIPGTLGTTTGGDGNAQLTYNDIPLYYFAADQESGDINGQGVGEVWYIVPPGMEFGDPPHQGTAMATPDREMATPEN